MREAAPYYQNRTASIDPGFTRLSFIGCGSSEKMLRGNADAFAPLVIGHDAFPHVKPSLASLSRPGIFLLAGGGLFAVRGYCPLADKLSSAKTERC